MRQVYSSVVSEIGYDIGKQELVVVWSRNGKRSIYEGVPAGLADEVMNAASVGLALRDSIQNNYTHRYG